MSVSMSTIFYTNVNIFNDLFQPNRSKSINFGFSCAIGTGLFFMLIRSKIFRHLFIERSPLTVTALSFGFSKNNKNRIFYLGMRQFCVIVIYWFEILY